MWRIWILKLEACWSLMVLEEGVGHIWSAAAMLPPCYAQAVLARSELEARLSLWKLVSKMDR